MSAIVAIPARMKPTRFPGKVLADLDGNLNETGPRNSNYRPRYMPGQLLALDFARNTSTMFSAPGYIFTVKREELVKAGGFRQPIEYIHMFGIVPFGVTGFDPSALFYFRHHEGQLNKEATNRGLVGAKEAFSLVRDLQIERRWQAFGPGSGRELVADIEKVQCDKATNWLTQYLYSWQLTAALRLIRTMWGHPQFWVRSAAKVFRRAFSIRPIRILLRPIIRCAFRLIPALASISPETAKLREKVNR